jgi:hypothetical protein
MGKRKRRILVTFTEPDRCTCRRFIFPVIAEDSSRILHAALNKMAVQVGPGVGCREATEIEG